MKHGVKEERYGKKSEEINSPSRTSSVHVARPLPSARFHLRLHKHLPSSISQSFSRQRVHPRVAHSLQRAPKAQLPIGAQDSRPRRSGRLTRNSFFPSFQCRTSISLLDGTVLRRSCIIEPIERSLHRFCVRLTSKCHLQRRERRLSPAMVQLIVPRHGSLHCIHQYIVRQLAADSGAVCMQKAPGLLGTWRVGNRRSSARCLTFTLICVFAGCWDTGPA